MSQYYCSQYKNTKYFYTCYIRHKVFSAFHFGFPLQVLAIHRIAREVSGPRYSCQSLQAHSNICLQFCIWDIFYVFLTAAHVITRQLCEELFPYVRISIYLNANRCLFFDFMLDIISFLLANFGFEFTVTINPSFTSTIKASYLMELYRLPIFLRVHRDLIFSYLYNSVDYHVSFCLSDWLLLK